MTRAESTTVSFAEPGLADRGEERTGADRDDAGPTADTLTPPLPGSLREFLLGNFPLIAAIGALIGIATFVGALPFYAGWIQTYLVFLLLAAAALIWLELLAQWPPELMIYRGPPPPGTPWRLTGFAWLVQLTMVGFLGIFLWRVPRLFVPAFAVIIGVLAWRLVLPHRLKSHRWSVLATVIVSLLVSIAVTTMLNPAYESVLNSFIAD